MSDNYQSRKLDELLIELGRLNAQFAALEAKLAVHLEVTIPTMSQRLNSHSERLRLLENSMSATKVKVGMLGGIAGGLALLGEIIMRIL